MTGDMASRNRALLAADNLAGRFNLAGKFIRVWNNWDGNEDGSFAGRAIIETRLFSILYIAMIVPMEAGLWMNMKGMPVCRSEKD